MQTYPFSIGAGNNASQQFGSTGNALWYESGSAYLQRTNLITYSEALDNAAWSKTGASITANASIDINGSLTMDKIVEDTGNSEHYATSALVALTSGVQYTASAYVKAGERNRFRIRFANAIGREAYFNIATLAVTSVTGDSASITPLPGGIYRLSLTFTSPATGSERMRIGLCDGTGTVSYVGDGVSGAYAWGAQLEIGAKAGDYIPTQGTAVTSIAGDNHIIISPDAGDDITLKPGQMVRLTEQAQQWTLKTYDGVSSIKGTIIIGSGDFNDANVNNTFKLDATFANNVNVTNTTGSPVPVAVQGTVPVSGNVNSTYSNTYGAAYASTAATTALTAVQVIAPGTNVNGVRVVRAEIERDVNGRSAFVAKSTAPTTLADGDVVLYSAQMGTSMPGMDKLEMPIVVPAGKGLYFISESAITAGQRQRNMLYTVL